MQTNRTEEVKGAYIEWINKVCEIFCQSSSDSSAFPQPSEVKISRHFALSLPERFNFRPTLATDAELHRFFENDTKLVLSFTDEKKESLYERIIFTFVPVKDLPPHFRDERKSQTLLRRLSVALRVVFSVARLLIGDRKFFCIDFVQAVEEISDYSRLELFALNSHLGSLKLLIERKNQTISDSVNASIASVSLASSGSAPAVVLIDEEYVKGKTPIRPPEIRVSAPSTILAVPTGLAAGQGSPGQVQGVPILGTSFVFARSEGSSPASASRDLLLDVWPTAVAAGRKSSGGSGGLLALGGPESLSSDGNFFHETSEVDETSSDEVSEKIGNFFCNGGDVFEGEGEVTAKLGALLLFARQVKVGKFKKVQDVGKKTKEYEEIDNHLKFLK